MGQFATFFGTRSRSAAAYVATRFNNIMDLLQLVFAFVNAPLFATFLLGMFWKRATGHGAFYGLLAGTLAAAIHHGLTLPRGGGGRASRGAGSAVASIIYPSEMAQNFWTAIFAWTTCFVVTIVVSLFTRPRPDEELVGLVYSLTARRTWRSTSPGTSGRAALGVVVLLVTAGPQLHLLLVSAMATDDEPRHPRSRSACCSPSLGGLLAAFGLVRSATRRSTTARSASTSTLVGTGDARSSGPHDLARPPRATRLAPSRNPLIERNPR